MEVRRLEDFVREERGRLGEYASSAGARVSMFSLNFCPAFHASPFPCDAPCSMNAQLVPTRGNGLRQRQITARTTGSDVNSCQESGGCVRIPTEHAPMKCCIDSWIDSGKGISTLSRFAFSYPCHHVYPDWPVHFLLLCDLCYGQQCLAALRTCEFALLYSALQVCMRLRPSQRKRRRWPSRLPSRFPASPRCTKQQ
jgi:hypothetical protein